MGTQEYLLLVMVIVVPLIIAVVVTLWTLEQARMRSKKNRKAARPTQSARSAAPTPRSDVPPVDPA
jgi:hypothetical protein